ncbi:hypothetical protein EVAR_92036_1 [Eumeta japonica]|uniref:Uncharacterized protein n=1 Tax=Eumeta variegata TaxID=151549 RepID=A0A4C1T0Z2_EUMVA|nr:hypothetical protein EVAR_92036_1 [Eumeta japonica]
MNDAIRRMPWCVASPLRVKAGYEADKYKEGVNLRSIRIWMERERKEGTDNTISNFRHERDREHPLFEIHRCRVNFDETRKPTSIGVGVENARYSRTTEKSMVLYDQRFPFYSFLQCPREETSIEFITKFGLNNGMGVTSEILYHRRGARFRQRQTTLKCQWLRVSLELARLVYI